VEKVKRLIEAGASVSTAVREALGMSITAFADTHGLSRQTVNSQITGRIAPNAAFLEALIAELGGTQEEWMSLLWRSTAAA
jgi:plasmid maintenance system antidote protein VapI